jgi:NTE family protein
LQEWLRQEPFSLCLSSGFFGFFAHAGFICALEEAGLRPSRVSGSSAGALVASCVAMGVPGERLAERFLSLQRADFWDPFYAGRPTLPKFGLLEGRLFEAELERIYLAGTAPNDAPTFDDCALPLTVSAWDVQRRQTVVLAQGPVAPAVHASCAFPGLFQMVPHQGRLLWDGGIADRPGLAGLQGHGTRVLMHHLESRSWWRTGDSAKVPRAPGVQVVTLGELPRSGPSKLAEGRRAFGIARNRMRRALTLPMRGDVLRVSR